MTLVPLFLKQLSPSKKRILLSLMLGIMLGITIAGTVYWTYQEYLLKPLSLSREWRYTLAPKATLSDLSQELIAQGLLPLLPALMWVALARFENKAHRIKAGEYAISVGTTPQKLLDLLIQGKTIHYILTIPEGWTFRQMMEAIHAHPILSHTLAGLDDAAIMKKIGHLGQHPEGRFYPDTYHFPKGRSDVELLQRAYRMMEKQLATAWKQRHRDLPLKTPDEALILASIIEKETGAPEERARIAGVFVRRLQKGMLLQTDPTIIYALGNQFDGNIRKRDLKVNSLYNTYVNPGLPPTPIALPGYAALQSALQPESGNALYFVATENGRHYFSATYEEHNCAVNKYQRKRPLTKNCQRYPQLLETDKSQPPPS